MRRSKGNFILSLLCLAAAAAVAFVLIPSAYSQQEATARVLRTAVPVMRGELIESADLESVEMGALNLPVGIILEQEQVVGRYAQTDLSAGSFIFIGQVGDHIIDETLDQIISEGLRLVTITVPSTAAGLSGHLRRGDIVTVASYVPAFDRYTVDGVVQEPAQVFIYPELRELTVYGVENAQTDSTEEAREQKENPQTISADPVPKMVTLIVSEAQALQLVEAEYSAKLHIIFERRELR